MEFEKEILNGANLLTTTDESETQQELIEVNAPDTAPQGQGAANVISARGDSQTVTAAGEKQTEKEPFMVIRYNHENRNLSREEAITAAQKGIRFSNLAEKLDRLAAIKNVSAEAFIDSMLSNERDTYKNGLLEKFGGNCDTVEQLMKLYDIEQNALYEKTVDERNAKSQREEADLQNRLGEEFKALKTEFPNLSDYKALPFEVRNFAENGKDLMFAYLLYRYNEEKRAAEALENAKIAAAASAGSLKGVAAYENSDIRAFKSGLWG